MLRRSLKLKLIFYELLLLIIIAGMYSVLPYSEYLPYTGLLFFFLGSIWIAYITIHKPLRKILTEMKLLITGKKFRRIYTDRVDEVGVLAHFFNEITASLESIGKKLEEHRRISGELNLAKKIQSDLLPKETPNIPYLEITAKTKSAVEIGGDSFDFLPQEKQTYFYIGDVTGHGIPAGLVMIMVDTLVTTFASMTDNCRDLLVNVNKFLKPRLQPNMFMTMLMARWQHEEKKMYFSGAGHEYLLHYHTDTGTCESIKGGGIALGMIPDASKLIQETELDFKEGDFLILYTDGIIEGKNLNGEQFGLDRLVKTVEENAGKAISTKDLFSAIAKEATIFFEDHIQEDDMSLIVAMHKKEEATTEKETTSWENNLPEEEKQDIKDTGIASK
ncbi:MAG: PP2C family protein-serine/threonine phosphatase [Patescibacteria group bacterium]|nr:PP2C family protein-serine/threonine phosphatase [Patescibacteria group bacterium]